MSPTLDKIIGVSIGAVIAAIIVSFVYYIAYGAEAESIQQIRSRGLEECRKLGGEAVMHWDYSTSEFYITDCRVR